MRSQQYAERVARASCEGTNNIRDRPLNLAPSLRHDWKEVWQAKEMEKESKRNEERLRFQITVQESRLNGFIPPVAHPCCFNNNDAAWQQHGTADAVAVADVEVSMYHTRTTAGLLLVLLLVLFCSLLFQ